MTDQPREGHPDPIDPATVPKYPVYRLYYAEDGENEPAADEGTAGDRDPASSSGKTRVELDGVVVEPAAGQSPTEAAVAAIAAKAVEHQRTAVRVVITTPSGDRWDMIVTADGEAIDVTDAETASSAPSSPRRRRRMLAVTGGILAGLLVAGGGATAVTLLDPFSSTEDADRETVSWQTPGAGVDVPVGLPKTFASTAAWSITVDDSNSVMKLQDGSLVIVDEQGRLTGLDAQTAQPIWRSNEAPQDPANLTETTWAGQPALVEAAQQSLRIWPIPDESTNEPVVPTTIELSSSAEVTYSGEAPLIYLGDYVALADDGSGQLRETPIPAGTIPIGVVDEEIIAVDNTAIYRTPIASAEEDAPQQTSSTSVSLEKHSSVTKQQRPDQAWQLSNDTVALSFDRDDSKPVIQVNDLTTGALKTVDSPKDLPAEQDEVLVDTDERVANIGPVTITWSAHNAQIAQTPELNDALLHGTFLWGQTREGPGFLNLRHGGKAGDATIQHYEAFTEDDPPPVLVTDEAAYIQASRVDETRLYRVERAATTGQPSSSKSPESEDSQ